MKNHLKQCLLTHMKELLNHSDFKAAVVSGVDIDMADSHPVTGIEEEHFVIEISPIKLKWAI